MPRGTHRGNGTSLLGCVALLAVTGCSVSSTAPEPSPVARAVPASAVSCDGLVTSTASKGGELPGLRLPCLGAGPDVTLADLTGRPTLINLWASWCAPCREEMPLLEEAFERQGEEIRFLGVVTRDDAETAIELAADLGIGYPHAVDPEGALLDSLGVPGLPVTLAVDADGRVLRTQIGQLTRRELTSLVQDLQASTSPVASPR